MVLIEKTEKPSFEPANKTHERKEKPLTKVIIRRLPPTMTQETFLNQVSPLPDYDHIYTVCGDSSLGEHSFARVYISFADPDDVFTFKEKFDNYVFVDAKGHEYPAVVEFAAFQRIPKKRNKQKTDPKCGTIESDPTYLEFLEMLKQQPELEEKPEYSLQLTNSESKNDVTTPLLEYIKQRKVERQRIKEERREERKRREFERRKLRDDDRRKHYVDKSPVVVKREKDVEDVQQQPQQEVAEKSAVFKAAKEKNKFEERRSFGPKTKYGANMVSKPESKKDYFEKKTEFKSRRNEFKNSAGSSKYQEDVNKTKDDPKFVKKVKKYSERREERKTVATKLNENKQSAEMKEEKEVVVEEKNFQVESESCGEKEKKETCVLQQEEKGNKEGGNDPRMQRRIKNKDRPTMALYQPGMLSKRKQVDNTSGDEVKQK